MAILPLEIPDFGKKTMWIQERKPKRIAFQRNQTLRRYIRAISLDYETRIGRLYESSSESENVISNYLLVDLTCSCGRGRLREWRGVREENCYIKQALKQHRRYGIEGGLLLRD
ncbi:hypothetical protein KIN20_033615 [Parelaphostrongylus tenuis]|uniref:Uncharacterized protein n=1 Tax=Parelaphostrongylus tenuis TaxID=148309 RepID=A0AAD5WJ04_PARTN|nr:hypothetical protein KIN20_033615 [Parelaphostrongylus tenuis]